MYKKSFILLILLSISSLSSVTAQGNSKKPAPKYKRLYVGDKLPDISFKNISNYPIKNPKTSDLKGKLIILDFWSTGCSSCIEAFPKMQKLQQQFEGKLQIITINPWEDTTVISKRFEKMKKYNPYAVLPSLPGINGDSTWLTLFPMRGVPQHVWIDGAGTILAITYDHNTTPEHIQAVLSGKKIDMELKDDFIRDEFRDKGYIQSTLSTMPPVYYSAFIPYFSLAASGIYKEDTVKGIFRSGIYNEDVISLYKRAFSSLFEKNGSERCLLEIKNADQFKFPDDRNLWDSWNRKYRFSYEVQGLLKEKKNWQLFFKRMRRDLNDFMGAMFGIEGNIEKRNYKSWILVKIQDGLLKTTGGESDEQYSSDRFAVTNLPFKYFVNDLTGYANLENIETGRIFIDETGIDEELKVDMLLTGNLNDISNLRQQLHSYGLDIIEGQREVDILIIKDN